MKENVLILRCRRMRLSGLLLGCLGFLCASASAPAQTLTNWALGYLHGGADDFDVKDTTRLILRPVGTIRVAHAYFTSTVTNLDTNHLYTLTGHMSEGWWRGDQGTGYDPVGDGHRDKFLVYIEVIGGLGNPTPDGRASLLATNAAPVYPGYPDLIYYATDSASATYAVQQKPDASGKIEVRLHYDKVGGVIYDKNWIMHADFGTITLTP
jgi:hypothetical protein